MDTHDERVLVGRWDLAQTHVHHSGAATVTYGRSRRGRSGCVRGEERAGQQRKRRREIHDISSVRDGGDSFKKE